MVGTNYGSFTVISYFRLDDLGYWNIFNVYFNFGYVLYLCGILKMYLNLIYIIYNQFK